MEIILAQLKKVLAGEAPLTIANPGLVWCENMYEKINENKKLAPTGQEDHIDVQKYETWLNAMDEFTNEMMHLENAVWMQCIDPLTKLYTITTWLYNTTNGSIILEIDRVFPWKQSGEDEETRKKAFDIFKKNFKPLAQTSIDKKTIVKWVTELEKITDYLDKQNILWKIKSNCALS